MGLEVKEMKDKMKVNVLGTIYDVEFLKEPDETMKALNADGYADNSVKQIKVMKFSNDDKDAKQIKDVEQYNKHLLRHELIHAFLYECGIDSGMQFHNEECVDFFAIQFPKLAKMFDNAKCKE